MRVVVVRLSEEQQLTLGPSITKFASVMLGQDEASMGGILVEVFGRLTPFQTVSEIAVANVVADEVELFREDPSAYEARVQGTAYQVMALQRDPPSDLGQFPPDLAKVLYEDVTVPQDATQADEWMSFADGIDGYGIAEQLGLGLSAIVEAMRRRYHNHGVWRGSYLDLRLTLFFEAHELRQSGPSYAVEALSNPDYVSGIEDLLTAVREASLPWVETGRRMRAEGISLA